MPDTLVYPTTVQLRQIEQVKIPTMVEDRIIFDYFPMESEDSAVLLWEQEDNWTGLQQLRGLNGQPVSVTRTGAKQYSMIPGYYGEFLSVGETELVQRRSFGSFTTGINISDIVAKLQDRLLSRRLDRIESMLWTLASTGTFSISSAKGIVHTDTFTIQSMTPSVPWTTFATAHPLADFRAISLLGRGQSVNFGANATAVMNQATMNAMLSNANPAQSEIGGKKVLGGNTINGQFDINLLMQSESLPKLRVYEGQYLNDSNTNVMMIPDGKVIVFGKRVTGTRLGAYRFTRNAGNEDLGPGPYSYVWDSYMKDPGPRQIQVHDGHNGGPIIEFPGAICVMNVY